MVVDSYALDIKDLLPAMETATKKLEFDGKSSPIDRHIAAFIGARANFEVDRFMMELAEPNPERALLGAFNLLATIQWRTGASSLPGLCTWLANLAQPIINSYHNREKRSELEREIPKLAKSGNLVEVMRVLDNRDARMTDQHEFERARAEWADAAAELREIKDGHLRKNEEAIILSQQLASLISVTISLITITLLLIGKFL